MKRPLANIIRKAVRAAKVSPAVIARAAGVSVPTLYSMMNGRTPAWGKLNLVWGVLSPFVVKDVSGGADKTKEVAEAYKEQAAQDKRARYGNKVTVAKEKLPKDERALLSRYRGLTKAHKRIVMGMMGLITR